MDIITAFKSEVIRPVVTNLVPGAAVLAPAVLLFKSYAPEAADWLLGSSTSAPHPTLAWLIFVASSLVVGLACENLGSHIEVGAIERILKRKRYPELDDEWLKYLTLTFPNEPIGQSYIRTLLLRMKFELSFGVAAFFVGFELLWLSGRVTTTPFGDRWWHFVLPFAAGIYLFIEAFMSGGVLAKVRRALVNEYHGLKNREPGVSRDASMPQ